MFKANSLSIFISILFLHALNGTFHAHKLNSNVKYLKKNLAPVEHRVFKPKLSESNESSEYLDYDNDDEYYDALDLNPSHDTSSATLPIENQNEPTQTNQKLLFNFVLHLLKPTLKSENTVERLETVNSLQNAKKKPFIDYSDDDSLK